ncbi:MAG: 2-oxo acid dehydrogenase subunit E2 [Gammaproteobacteria bacterium]|nr:2-oxo acid dehydrogenase subunit E2 [Gammaproteobacteria bacterium]
MKIFHLPDLGEGLAEAEIREWYVKEGEEVVVDQPLVSMETAKAVVDVPSPYAGKIIKLYGQPNDIIPTHGELISFESDEDEPEVRPKNSVVGSLEESVHKLDDEMIVGHNANPSTTPKAMPAARLIAKELQINLAEVIPSGPRGLITPEDVKRFNAERNTSSSKHLFEGGEPLRGVRRAMSQAMTLSHQEIVPVTIIEDADISALPSQTDLTLKVLRAIVQALHIEPALNAWFDGKQLTRKLIKEVKIGLAVDSDEGLFVPVLQDIGQQSDAELRQLINDIKEGVKNRTLPADAMTGATFTLSNFGTIAGRYATPIIVPPMVAILGCGRSREIAMVKEGIIKPGRILPLSLTFDHRAVTGGEATRFLAAVIKNLN